MSLVLALTAAVAYGSADYVGGIAARRAPAVSVALAAQMVGLVLVLAALPFVGAEVSGRAVAAGAAAGIFGGLGLRTLLLALARGPMSVVAPTTALSAAVVPIGFGLALGDRPTGLTLAGIAVSLGAVVLITRERPVPGAAHASARGVLGLALGGGAIFGTFFVFLHQAGPDAGLVPLVAARCTSIPVLALLAHRAGQDLRPRTLFAAPGVAVSGALDMAANIAYLFALRHGMLAVVSAVTCLYPASTVALAQTHLRERLEAPQLAGMGVAALAALMIALS